MENKIPYIRQGQEFSRETLNSIIKAINSMIISRPNYEQMMEDLRVAANNSQQKINAFIEEYKDIIEDTPNMMEMLMAVKNLTAPTIDLGLDLGVLTIEADDPEADPVTYGVYSDGERIGDAPFIPLQGPPGAKGDAGNQGDTGADGEAAALNIIGYGTSSSDIPEDGEFNIGDCYVVNDESPGGGTFLYMYDNEGGLESSWRKLQILVGPAGPAGKAAEVYIFYSSSNEASTSTNYGVTTYASHHKFISITNDIEKRKWIRFAPWEHLFEIEFIDSDEELSIERFENAGAATVTWKIKLPRAKDGKSIEAARVENGNLKVKFSGESTYTDIGNVEGPSPVPEYNSSTGQLTFKINGETIGGPYNVKGATGAPGADGADGRSLTLKSSVDTFYDLPEGTEGDVRWVKAGDGQFYSYSDDEWVDLDGAFVNLTVEDGSITTEKIEDGSITNAKLDEMVGKRLKGNNGEDPGSPIDLTPSQVRVMLDVPMTGHNHDGTYSPYGHNHTGTYSPDGHNHTGTYAPSKHDHDILSLLDDAEAIGAGNVNAPFTLVAKAEEIPAYLSVKNGGIATAYIKSEAITNDKLAKMPPKTIKGYNGTEEEGGTPVNLTVDNLFDMLKTKLNDNYFTELTTALGTLNETFETIIGGSEE